MFNTFCPRSVTFSREGPLIPKNPSDKENVDFSVIFHLYVDSVLIYLPIPLHSDLDKSCIYVRSKPKVPRGSSSNTSAWWRLTGRTAVPNNASSPIWDARTSLRRILRASLSCWAAARELKGVRPPASSALKRLLPPAGDRCW